MQLIVRNADIATRAVTSPIAWNLTIDHRNA
jgi:hypothetical protein